MTMRNVAALAAVIVGGLACSNLCCAQDPDPLALPGKDRVIVHEMKLAVEAQKMDAKEASKAAARAATLAKTEEIRVRKFFPAAFGESRHLTKLQEVAERYSNSKDEDEKKVRLEQLHDLAAHYFEEDMAVRKKELADIESRLEKLRAQLERRRAKKDEIVDLQVKVAINEAEGLGFTSAPRDHFKFNMRVPDPVVYATAPAKVDVLMRNPMSSDMIPPPLPVEAPAPTVIEAETVDMTLSLGAKGDAVRLLQKVLNKSLDPSPELNIDGDFGPETDKALRLFQSEHDLEESGVVDEATQKKLELPAEMPPFMKK
jgi:murein L,D-transpeptidase YcbB/YkuD